MQICQCRVSRNLNCVGPGHDPILHQINHLLPADQPKSAYPPRTRVLRSGRFRQVYPAAPRLDVRPIAREIAEIAAAHQEDERLRRNANKIIVLVGKVKELAPGSAVKQTLAARRSRFTTALAEEMRAHGFIRDPTVKGSLAWYTYIEQQDNPGPADSA